VAFFRHSVSALLTKPRRRQKCIYPSAVRVAAAICYHNPVQIEHTTTSRSSNGF